MCRGILQKMSGVEPSPEVITLMGDVAELLLENLDQLVADMDAAEVELSPVAGSDVAVTADMSASNRANAVRLLTLFARRDAQLAPFGVPPEALDVARTVARRGLDLDVIFHSYRRGQNIAWRHYMAQASRIVPPGPLLVELLDVSSQRMFEFVDHVVSQVIAAAQHEREEVLGGALARRAEAIRLILDDAPIDTDRAAQRLDYELNRFHTALVLWTTSATEVQGALESAANLLARAAGARPPLTLSAGASVLWAWLSNDSDPKLDALQQTIGKTEPNIRVAVGPPGEGIAGFRRSHEAALTIQNLLTGYPEGPRLGLYRDLEVTALAAHNIDRATEFVAATLGPLAESKPGAERLRETLRVYLDEAENAPRAAARLHTHRNTVLQRVARATELLGHRPGDRRLAIELALELAHQIGPRVLNQDPITP